MNEMLALLNAVLTLSIGEVHVIREDHLPDGTFYRYRDGWHFFLLTSDRHSVPKALLGFSFRDPQDVADFLTGALGKRVCNFAILGERL